MDEATNAEIRAWRENKFNCINGYSAKYMSLLLDRLEEAEAKLEAITSYVSTDLFVRLRDLYQVGHDMFGDDLSEIITDLQEMLEKRDK